VLIVSSVIPRGVDKTTNIVDSISRGDRPLEREFVEAEQAAYMADVGRGSRDSACAWMQVAVRCTGSTQRNGRISRRWKRHAAFHEYLHRELGDVGEAD